MTVKTSLVTVLLWGIAFACVGAAIGATIGTLAPEYYRSVFRHGDSPNFNPLQVGIGLGATQGIASGAAISIVVLALLAWRDVRAARATTGKDCPNNSHVSRSWTVHALWGVVTTMSVILVAAVAFVLGGIMGQQQLYQSWTDRKLDKLATILESDEFKGVEADYSSAAQVYLTGTIKDSATRDALRNQLVVTFGTDEADEMIWRVDVAQ
jgi:hypothetical protein